VRLTAVESSLRRNRKLRLARPWTSASGGGLRVARPQGSALASTSEGGLRLARPRGSPQPRPRKVVSASPDPRARPQPRPREESRPRPTLTPASGGVYASPNLGLGPTAPRRMHHYPTPSQLRLWGNKTGVPSRLAPVTGNDSSPRASMTTAVLSPLRKQGDISKVPTTPTAVLLQGSSAPPTATIPRAQGSSTSPTATLACTQGFGTSLSDTLAHSYTPLYTWIISLHL
jgi:hypothetical protein